MLRNTVLAALLASQAQAFPWVAQMHGYDAAEMKRRDMFASRSIEARTPGDQASCPVNPNHVPAAPATATYPYCGAFNGGPGNQTCANNKVPADGDTAHQYQAPGQNDIRGPCPGLNTAANHGFLARDGITTFQELTDAQQNVYGVGYDLAILLAVFGVELDGDPITMKLSIGCDATPRTATPGAGPELGLDGHNKFEGDTSLTRNDYFTAGGDNFKFNSTLYEDMINNYCGNACNLQAMAKYRYARYQWSLNHNGNFYYGPKSLLLYGAASFVYELFPSLGPAGTPDPTTMSYFFEKEELPPNWFSRVSPYTIEDVSSQIGMQYQLYPVAFGANTGNPNSFVGFGETGPSISNGSATTPAGVACALYQLATENDPASLGGGGSGSLPLATLTWAATKLNPIFSGTGAAAQFGCPIAFNDS
ncbi:Aromatic peroxygenase [Lecanosticta acicola]|uniref:Aromatic peroxygenase n=1 Tax=Lecanosticta acicola TaxID=111012 RepID=A0AAI9E952_9PEZI|nr:Aromatic peroxygenase [Lecanosticta acicola]